MQKDLFICPTPWIWAVLPFGIHCSLFLRHWIMFSLFSVSPVCFNWLVILSPHKVHVDVSCYQPNMLSSYCISLNVGSGTSPLRAQLRCPVLVSLGRIAGILLIISLTVYQLCLQALVTLPAELKLNTFNFIGLRLPSSAYARPSCIYYFIFSIFCLKYSKQLQTKGQKFLLVSQQMAFLLVLLSYYTEYWNHSPIDPALRQRITSY